VNAGAGEIFPSTLACAYVSTAADATTATNALMIRHIRKMIRRAPAVTSRCLAKLDDAVAREPKLRRAALEVRL
jgi:hypothetical protein